MKKMNYEQFIATQTEIIEKASEVDVEVYYKNVQLASFFGKFWSAKKSDIGFGIEGFSIEMENDDCITIPPESEIEVYEGDEMNGTDAEYIILSDDLQIYIGIMAA